MTKLKEVRESKKLSQSELSKKANISIRTLQDYETGKRNIDGAKLFTLIKIAQSLNCKVSKILENQELVKSCKSLNI